MQVSKQGINYGWPGRIMRVGRYITTASLSLTLLLTASLGAALAQTDGSSAGTSNYVLGVGDAVRISVHGEDDLTVQTRLNDSGVVSFPFLGEMQLVGLTISQAEQRIAEGLKPDYLKSPQVQVSVAEYRAFYINGEVRRPGGYAYSPGLTVQKAAALAGGFTDRASTRKMFVIREHDTQQGRQQVLLETAINPGDTVIIEEGLF